ncbi:hypothetical protein RIF29_27345 [Crotalaria pallida]|uniref:Uncharacterized protein n=1 Tax=Crotalaria pallida TaxID=3830 RepID=A0AAN9EPE5_CROPI
MLLLLGVAVEKKKIKQRKKAQPAQQHYYPYSTQHNTIPSQKPNKRKIKIKKKTKTPSSLLDLAPRFTSHHLRSNLLSYLLSYFLSGFQLERGAEGFLQHEHR